MTVKQAIEFFELMFSFWNIMREKGQDFTIQAKSMAAFKVIQNRIIELENENGKLKIQQGVK